MQNEKAPQQRPWLWPVIVSLPLALLCVWLLMAYFNAKPQSTDATQVQAHKALQEEIRTLQALKGKDPCAIATALPLVLSSVVKPRAMPEQVSPEQVSPAQAIPEKVVSSEKTEAIEKAETPELPEKAEISNKDLPLAPSARNAHIESATVFIVGTNDAGDIAIGTGFFVAPQIIATNLHVVEGSTQLFVTNKTIGTLVPVSVKALSANPQRDYAVLESDVALPEGIPSLSLRLGVEKTEKVSAWGYPTAISKNDPQFLSLIQGDLQAIPEVIYSEGVISAVLQRTPPIIMHTTPLSPGNSGGPLLDANGYVVGINTMISLDDDSYRQTSLSLPSADLLDFLQSAGVNPQTIAGSTP